MNDAPRRVVTVATVGPECTGKSTLAADLSEYYGAEVSAEAARLLAEERREVAESGTPASALLDASDVERIARTQVLLEAAAETRARGRGRPLVVRDTDLISTVVYARHYYGSCPPWIVTAARERRADRYLLCDVDVPWADDGVRDRPHAREALFASFADALTEFGADTVVVRGDPVARLRTAVECVDALLEKRRKAAERR